MTDGSASRSLAVVIAAAGEIDPLLRTLQSLVLQGEAASEIRVADCGLADSSRLASAAAADRRIQIHRNETRDAVGSAQDAIEQTSASVIVLPSPGDVLLAGSLVTLLEAVTVAPGASAAYAYAFEVDHLGRVSRNQLRRRRSAIREDRTVGFDTRGALPTFRREALLFAGGLRGDSLREAVERALKVVGDTAEVRRIREFVCARPAGEQASPPSTPRRALRRPRSYMAAVQKHLRTWLPNVPRPYDLLRSVLNHHSFSRLQATRSRGRRHDPLRIAYVLRHYPTPSELVVRREVAALRTAGIHVEVFAYSPFDPPVSDDPACPAGPVTYFTNSTNGADASGVAFLKRVASRRPLTVAGIVAWIARHSYRPWKRWSHDRELLLDAAKIASVFAEHKVTHVHSPWANDVAFRSFIAARLLGASFSVEARASEIRRTMAHALVADRLLPADFVVTNSRYNERFLASLVSKPPYVVYEGVDLGRFKPPLRRSSGDGPPKLLAVGRLVEPKGFTHLLGACRILRERGIAFTCDIIGGPQPFDVATWVHLRKRYNELELGPIVRFHGAQSFSVVHEALRQADVFVLPCVEGRDGSHDITPGAIIEAMAMALPVVSTTSGAVPEIVEHDRSGVLVPPGDETALAGAIGRLLQDESLRNQMGAEGRRIVEERFDAGRNVEQHAALFRSSGREAFRQA